MDNSSHSVLSVGFLFMAVYLQDTVSNIPPVWIAAGARNLIDSLNKRQRVTRLIRATVPSANTSRKVYARKNRDGEALTRRKLTEKDTPRPSGFMNTFLPSTGRLTALNLQC